LSDPEQYEEVKVTEFDENEEFANDEDDEDLTGKIPSTPPSKKVVKSPHRAKTVADYSKLIYGSTHTSRLRLKIGEAVRNGVVTQSHIKVIAPTRRKAKSEGSIQV